MEAPQKLEKIGVIVDSASLFNMMRIIGIGQVNFYKLRDVISNEVSQAIQSPVVIDFAKYVTAANNPKRFEKRVTAAGFQFIPTDHRVKGSDDEEINKLILHADTDAIAALIVVTADVLDYVGSLEINRPQNLHIFIAAVTANESDGRPPLSLYSLATIQEKRYTLINLEAYKDDLLLTEWVDAPVSSNAAAEAKTKFLKRSIAKSQGFKNCRVEGNRRAAYIVGLVEKYCIVTSDMVQEAVQHHTFDLPRGGSGNGILNQLLILTNRKYIYRQGRNETGKYVYGIRPRYSLWPQFQRRIGVAKFGISLIERDLLQRPDVVVSEWHCDKDVLLEEYDKNVRPFIPAARFVLEQRGIRIQYFLELETNARNEIKIIAKLQLYKHYYEDMKDPAQIDLYAARSIRVLFVCTQKEDVNEIARIVHKECGETDLFLITWEAQWIGVSIFAEIWRTPGGKNLSLI